VVFAKLYDRKTPVTAADLLNDRVLAFFEEFEISLLRMLTDRGTEYCGNPEHHEYELYLALEDIDHTRTKAQSPQTNGICERFHKTILNEFYRVTFRKKLYKTIEELQADLDQWLKLYNEERPPSGPMVLRQDADADLHRQCPVSQREDVGGVSGGITTTDLRTCQATVRLNVDLYTLGHD
jgi:hypothetical protein